MFARSTSIQGQPELVAAAIAYLRDELMPQLTALPGCIGLSLIVEWATGLCIVTSAWTSIEAMRDSADPIAEMREEAIETFNGTAPTVAEWEIALVHRQRFAGAGACVRATWMEAGTAPVEQLVPRYREQYLPRVEQLPGFCSASVLVNREWSWLVTSHCYESERALARSREPAAALRSEAARRMGAVVMEVREFELVVAHLRVPELV
jgi:hypothetical protein